MSGPSLQLLRALDFAARRHASQRRKGATAEPYVNHLIEVARILADAGAADAALLQAAVLHDVVEDTPTSLQDVADAFGAEVAGLVAEVSDDKTLPKAERKRLQVEKTPRKSERARLLKLADKTSNLRSIAHSPPQEWGVRRMAEYVAWAEDVAAGCCGLNAALEAQFKEAAQEARAYIASQNTGEAQE